MTRLSDVTIDTNPKILRKHLSARARPPSGAPPPRAARRPTPKPRRRPAARRPQRPCFGAVRTAAAPRRRTSRPAKRNESAQDATQSRTPAAMTSQRRRALRHRDAQGRRRPLPLETDMAFVFLRGGGGLRLPASSPLSPTDRAAADVTIESKKKIMAK